MLRNVFIGLQITFQPVDLLNRILPLLHHPHEERHELSEASKEFISQIFSRSLSPILLEETNANTLAPFIYPELEKVSAVEGASMAEEFFQRYLKRHYTPAWKGSTATLLSLYNGQRPPKVVVDAGSGPGVSAESIVQELSPRKLMLVDIVGEALNIAQRRLESSANGYKTTVEFRQGNVESIDEAVQWPVDLIVMRSVVSYVHPTNYEQMFRRMRKVLRRGGLLIFDVPLEESPLFLTRGDAAAVALAVAFGRTYNIPTLESLGVLTRRTKVGEVSSALGRVGFSDIYSKRFVDEADANDVRIAAALTFKNFLELLKDGPVSDAVRRDYGMIKKDSTQIVEAASQILSNYMPYREGVMAFRAVK